MSPLTNILSRYSEGMNVTDLLKSVFYVDFFYKETLVQEKNVIL